MTPSTGPRARVLVVDDSAFARKVLRETLTASPDVDVVGIARDGLEALEKIAELLPDVITLDLMMPNLDGIGVLRELIATHSNALVILVSSSDRDSEVVVEALTLGAFDVVKKPTALATDVLYELSSELVRKVLAAAESRAAKARLMSGGTPVPLGLPRPYTPPGEVELVVIGTSTGGPNALTRVLTALPANFNLPIAIALHIPADYTLALARRLDHDSAIQVVEAGAVDTILRPGVAVLARGGAHMRIERRGTILVARTTSEPGNADYFPSVDLLFESAAKASRHRTLGVVLTGMGNDGLRGSREIVEHGGCVITESETSCVVYGMPRCVAEAGLSAVSRPLDGIAAELVTRTASARSTTVAE